MVSLTQLSIICTYLRGSRGTKAGIFNISTSNSVSASDFSLSNSSFTHWVSYARNDSARNNLLSLSSFIRATSCRYSGSVPVHVTVHGNFSIHCTCTCINTGLHPYKCKLIFRSRPYLLPLSSAEREEQPVSLRMSCNRQEVIHVSVDKWTGALLMEQPAPHLLRDSSSSILTVSGSLASSVSTVGARGYGCVNIRKPRAPGLVWFPWKRKCSLLSCCG